jgi:hypothetical protein
VERTEIDHARAVLVSGREHLETTGTVRQQEVGAREAN